MQYKKLINTLHSHSLNWLDTSSLNHPWPYTTTLERRPRDLGPGKHCVL